MTADDDDIGLETPDADRLEQARPLADDPDDDGPRNSGRLLPGSVVGTIDADVDADEADLLEQSISVPVDDDYRDGGS